MVGALDRWLTGLSRTAVDVGRVDEFTQTALSDFAEAAVRVHSADGAAIVLYQDESPHWVVASDASSLAFARAEAAVREGPCLAAVRQERAIRSDDLSSDPRWLPLASAALAHDVRAMLAVPINAPLGPIGVCSLTSGSSSIWNDRDANGVLAAAGVLGRLLQASADARATAVLAEQLQHALDHRIVIEQAKGALIERMGISAEAAFELLRTTARSSRRKLVDVATVVLDGQAIPAPSKPRVAQPALGGLWSEPGTLGQDSGAGSSRGC